MAHASYHCFAKIELLIIMESCKDSCLKCKKTNLCCGIPITVLHSFACKNMVEIQKKRQIQNYRKLFNVVSTVTANIMVLHVHC